MRTAHHKAAIAADIHSPEPILQRFISKNPVTGYMICASYNTSAGVNVGFDTLRKVGTLNDKSLVVWNDPLKNAEVKL